MTELARNEEPAEKPEESDNPYAAPKVHVVRTARSRKRLPLASRGARFIAAFVDNLVYLPCVLPLLLGNANEALDSDLPFDALGLLGVSLFALMGLAVLGTQIFLLVKDGTTLGKRLVGVRIVTVEGERVGAARILVLRTLLPALAGGMCALFGLIDALFIFGVGRRCVHDFLAGTIVVAR